VRVADLAVVAPGGPAEPPRAEKTAPAAAPDTPPPPEPASASPGPDDILGKIERMADLHGRGILTTQEFEAKKAELLGRL
jgi:hypothetical protein